MRIAIFTDTFYPQINGIVTSTINLAKGLADRGHEVFILAPKNSKNETREFKYKNIRVRRIPGIPAIFYPGFKFVSPFSLSSLWYIKVNKIDVIHFQTPVSMGINAIAIGKILRIPIIGTFHTSIAHPEYRKHVILDHPALDQISWAYLRAYYNQCNVITCPSETTRKELQRKKFRSKIISISNGIDLLNIAKIKPHYKKSLLFVGRIAHEKNIFYLLDCLKTLSEKIPEIKLTIVGDGPQMSEFKKKIKKLNLEHNIVLKGSMDHYELMNSSIYQDNPIFVTASLTETQGITLLEAQARGLVGVGISSGGTKDLIKNGYNGYLLKKGDKKGFVAAIIKLLSHRGLYERLRKNSLMAIEKHDMEKVVGIWEKEYAKLMKPKI